jgi:hypothetical protein
MLGSQGRTSVNIGSGYRQSWPSGSRSRVVAVVCSGKTQTFLFGPFCSRASFFECASRPISSRACFVRPKLRARPQFAFPQNRIP